MSEENQITMFEVKTDNLQNAIKYFVSGNTPNEFVKQKPGKGGGVENYVNIYWMIEQIGLLTGFRWSSECLEERLIPNTDKPREIGAKMRVTIWDKDNRQYQHTSWGQKEVGYKKSTGLPLSIFDDLKAAYSDGIKKCLSYFGIARDIYGGKELEFFADDNETSNTSNKGMDELDRYINKKGLTYDQVFEMLNIQSIAEITDYKLAYETIKSKVEGGK